MPASKSKTVKPPPGPDDLVRGAAGTYRSGDDRFEVQKSDQGWYLVDTQQANEFGQQLIHGPLPTLDAVRAQLPGAREIRPLLRGAAKGGKQARRSEEPARRVAQAAPSATKAAPRARETWIDRLPRDEAKRVRELIGALESEGLPQADQLVRRHREDALPVLATRIIERRLQNIVDATPEEAQAAVRDALRRAVAVLGDEGLATRRPLPRWTLVEVSSDETPPVRRIRPQVG